MILGVTILIGVFLLVCWVLADGEPRSFSK